MGEYRTALTLSLRHDYFSDTHWPELRVTPHPHTRALLGQHALLERFQGSTLTVYCHDDRLEGLQQRAADDGPVVLTWRITAADPTAYQYTQLPPRDGCVLMFENGRADDGSFEEGAARPLHAAPRVGEQDVRAWSDHSLAPWITQRDTLAPPLAFVCLALDTQALGDLAAGNDGGGRAYEIHFAARETFWQYYLVGHHADGDAQITDASGEHAFDFLGHRSLEGREAAVYRSQTPIALAQRAASRLQLRAPGSGNGNGGRLLVPRLPVPRAPYVLARTEFSQQPQALLSEIFVYL